MYTQRNVEFLQIGDTAEKTTANYPDSLNVGEIGVFNAQGVRLTEATAAAAEKFILATKLADGSILRSPDFMSASVKSAKRLVYTASTNQIDCLGFDGTGGAIEVLNDNLYKVHIQVQELLRSNTDGRKWKYGAYQSSPNATQEEIAQGLHKSLVLNFDREPEKFIVFDMLMGAGSDVAIAGTGDVTFTATSTTISAATDIDAVLTVGDYIRVGTTATDPVYKIVSIDATANTAQINVPFQGTTGTVVEAGLASVPSAALAALAAGVKFTGQELEFKRGKLNYEVARWETQLLDFGTTTYNSVQAATPGSGEINDVSQMEWFLIGNEGEYHREGFSVIDQPRSTVNIAVAGGGYSMIRLTFDGKDVVSFSDNVSPQVMSIAVPATTPNYALDATADDITDVLEVIAFGSANGNLDLG